jgi:signal transduction histidine kinase
MRFLQNAASLLTVWTFSVMPLCAQTADGGFSAIPMWLWYVLNVSVVLFFMIIGFYIAMLWLERRAKERGRRRTKRLSLILNASGMSIWLYDVEKKSFLWYDKEGVMQRSYPAEQMPHRVGPENFMHLMECLGSVAREEKAKASVELYTHSESNLAGKKRIYEIDASVLRRYHGKPSVVIAVCTDITEERVKQETLQKNLSRYRSVFHTAMADMVYYDENGYIADMNASAQRNSHISLQYALASKVNLRDIMGDVDLSHFDCLYSTQFLNLQEDTPLVRSTVHASSEIYEMLFVPMHRPDGSLSYIYSSGRNVTEVVKTYRALQNGLKEVKQSVKAVTDYVKNINYVLDVGGVRMVEYSLESHTLIVWRSLDNVQIQLTQSRIMTLVDEHSKKKAMRMLHSMDNRTTEGIEEDLKTTLRIHGMPLWLQFRFVPRFDEQHHVTGFYGLCRDVSKIKATDLLLEKETERAQEVENLKNSFLRNMSYEIRIPLNAVVGFAELFEQEHGTEEETLFINEIKENSAHLLHLINDILFLSRLDAHMIEMQTEVVDFAQTFDAHCHLGWSNFQKEGVSYIVEKRYESLVIEIDDTNVGRIIEQITANAAQHTEKGMVRARYEYANGKLMIVVEDTGSGMSEETLQRIYERFASAGNRGTGLGLPICKELADQLGGNIEITSSEGQGTTVWITIPCKLVSVERKKEV